MMALGSPLKILLKSLSLDLARIAGLHPVRKRTSPAFWSKEQTGNCEWQKYR